jgi:nucleoside-diphosphate-sugar epimerase
MDKPSRIVITGASGWIGRSVVKTLIRIYGTDILEKTELYGTSSRELKLTSGITINVRKLQTISTSGKINLFVPLAFQTQDKLNEMSKLEYIQKNKDLIDLHSKIIQDHAIERAVFFSSGIVAMTPDDLERTESYWVYKELKTLEENVFFENFSKQSTNVAACRLFSVSGSEMQDPKKYALGDFLLCAMAKRRITLNSQKKIYRKYVDIEDICESLIKETNNKSVTLIESGGTKLTLLELARNVSQIFELGEEFLAEVDESNLESDHYYSTSLGMEDLFAKHSIHALNLEQQIRKTAAGLHENGFVSNG